MAEKAILLDGSVTYTELTPEQYSDGKNFLADKPISYEYDDEDPTYIRLVGSGPGSVSDETVKSFEAALG